MGTRLFTGGPSGGPLTSTFMKLGWLGEMISCQQLLPSSDVLLRCPNVYAVDSHYSEFQETSKFLYKRSFTVSGVLMYRCQLGCVREFVFTVN